MYRPTISRSLSINRGSLESLNVSLRCGCKAKARQMRPTVLRLKPDALTSERVLQMCGLFRRRFQCHRQGTLPIGSAHPARRAGGALHPSIRPAGDHAAERVYVSQLHAAPCLRQVWGNGKRMKTSGANAKQIFRKTRQYRALSGTWLPSKRRFV